MRVFDTPFAVMSTVQTSGRGRLGRDWKSPPGGLYLSVLLGGGLLTTQPNSIAALSPISALAVRDALQNFTAFPVHIKWPNDVITQNGKLVGILVEIKTIPNTDSTCIVFGIGVNVNRPEIEVFSKAAYLDDAPKEHCGEGLDGGMELEPVAAKVIERFLSLFKRWQNAEYSFAPFASDYVKHLSQQGKEVIIWDGAGNKVASGKVVGVDDNARLLVSSDKGVKAVVAGEVTLRQPTNEQ